MSAWYQAAPSPPMHIPEPVTRKDLARYEREYLAADRKSKAASDRRANLEPGSSRAAITTANARWATAAEYRDRLQERYERAKTMLVEVQP